MTKKDEKSLAKSDPMGRLFALNRFDDFFNEVQSSMLRRFDDLWANWDVGFGAFEKLQPRSSFPKINVIEKEDSYDVEIAVAGFDREDVNLELKDNTLLIKADKTEEKCCDDDSCDDDCKNYLTREIASRSFRRAVIFPAEVNAEDVSAKYDNGIIICRVGKVEEDKPCCVQIDID